jgi:hypothetical protein
MLFGVKNGPPTYQKTLTKTFREYMEIFMKIFQDDFMVYSDMESFAKAHIMFSKL